MRGARELCLLAGAAALMLIVTPWVQAQALPVAPPNLSLPGPGSPAATSLGAWKAAHNSGQGPAGSALASSLTPGKRALLSQMARLHVAPEGVCCGPSSAYVGQDQQTQINEDYCGAAAVSETLHDMSWAWDTGASQQTAASLLRTNSNGTAWYGVQPNVPSVYLTNYPVPDVLNYGMDAIWYGPVGLPDSPTSGDVTSYENNLASDITEGYPVVGDAYEVAGSPYHLPGHPISETIYHWFMIYGFFDYANYTAYEDSATNMNVYGWSVQPYNTISSSTLVVILGGRGYVW